MKSLKYIVLCAWTFICLFPLYWLVTFSLKTNDEIFGENVIGLPKNGFLKITLMHLVKEVLEYI